MKIRALIVDDESLARERVRLLLRDEADVEILGECANGLEAIAAIEKQSPDLMFLDVQMPEVDGFGVLQRVTPEKLPVVIFTTAYDQHALKAFDAHALDYLLKPFKPSRFKEAVQRAREQINNKHASATARGLMNLLSERPTPATTYLSRLTVKTPEKVVFVSVGEIDTIESAGNYAVVHVGKESHILRETLTNLEAKLPPEKFFRISRSAIVNLEQVKELQPMFKGENVIVLKNGRQLVTTRSIREVQEKLEFL